MNTDQPIAKTVTTFISVELEAKMDCEQKRAKRSEDRSNRCYTVPPVPIVPTVSTHRRGQVNQLQPPAKTARTTPNDGYLYTP